MAAGFRLDLHLLFLGSQPVRVALECSAKLPKKLLLEMKIENLDPVQNMGDLLAKLAFQVAKLSQIAAWASI